MTILASCATRTYDEKRPKTPIQSLTPLHSCAAQILSFSFPCTFPTA